LALSRLANAVLFMLCQKFCGPTPLLTSLGVQPHVRVQIRYVSSLVWLVDVLEYWVFFSWCVLQ